MAGQAAKINRSTKIDTALASPAAVRSRAFKRAVLHWSMLGAVLLLAGCTQPNSTATSGTVAASGTVVIKVDQPAVQVVLDGKAVATTPSGESAPLELSVALGKHRLELIKDGFKTADEQFDLAAGERQTFHLSLGAVAATTAPDHQKQAAAESAPKVLDPFADARGPLDRLDKSSPSQRGKIDGPKTGIAADEEEELMTTDPRDPGVDPTELNVDSPISLDPSVEAAPAFEKDADPFKKDGDPLALGVTEPGEVDGIGPQGHGPDKPGGDGSAFGGRDGRVRDMTSHIDVTAGTERAVAAALDWFKRHQSKDGSWSLKNFDKQCVGTPCTGTSEHAVDAAGTAFGLLPFLAAGLTHQNKNPYQETIDRGLNWLVAHQKASGDLSFNSTGNDLMYTHGLATIALCEAYGLSGDARLRDAAQKAVHFLEVSQDKGGGGWRYMPNEAGDTSVMGWEISALKSAKLAGLKVDDRVFGLCKKYLTSVSGNSKHGGLFAYQPNAGPTPPMTAAGLLGNQFLGTPRDSELMTEGTEYLMANRPKSTSAGDRNVYYWYFATQVMHNQSGPDWDTWNRSMRKLLVDSQIREGCAQGSWDPAKPTQDQWGQSGGRVMQTSLSCLTLEVYYRYLPIYKVAGPKDVGEKPSDAGDKPANTEGGDKPKSKQPTKESVPKESDDPTGK